MLIALTLHYQERLHSFEAVAADIELDTVVKSRESIIPRQTAKLRFFTSPHPGQSNLCL